MEKQCIGEGEVYKEHMWGGQLHREHWDAKSCLLMHQHLASSGRHILSMPIRVFQDMFDQGGEGPS